MAQMKLSPLPKHLVMKAARIRPYKVLISCTLLPRHPRVKTPSRGTHWLREHDGPGASLEVVAKGKLSIPMKIDYQLVRIYPAVIDFKESPSCQQKSGPYIERGNNFATHFSEIQFNIILPSDNLIFGEEYKL
jgi:hypothetical protein